MKNLILTLSFFCSFLTFVNGQETEAIFISYSPNNIILRIDGSDVIPLKDKPNAFILNLPVGKHEIEAWAEGFEVQKYNVEISSERINNLIIGLNTLNSGFEAHLEAQRKYRNYKLKNIAINLTAIGLTSLLVIESISLSSDNSAKKIRLDNNLALAKIQYAEAINDIELANAKRIHTNAVRDLNNRKKAGETIQAITIGVGAITIFRLIKELTKEKMERPVYKDSNPFVFVNEKKYNSSPIVFASNGIAIQF